MLDRPVSFSWEDWFAHASLPQRAAALGLAQKQGLVYPYQLPAAPNGTKTTENGKHAESGLASWITRLLAGKVELSPVSSREPFQCFDTQLDALQIEAVARALATPDLFLLNGPPGTGKSRVVTEILAQASARGWRTLFLANHPESIDVALQPLANRADTFALRYLDADEKPNCLPADIQKLSADSQQVAFRDRLISAAREFHDTAQAASRNLQHQEPAWNEIVVALQRINDAKASLDAARNEFARVSHEVSREFDANDEASPFSQKIARALLSHQADMQRLAGELRSANDALARVVADLAGIDARIDAITPAYQAKTSSKIWSAAFWTNLFNSSILKEMESLKQSRSEIDARRDSLARDVQKLESRRKESSDQFEALRNEQIGEEIARRSELLSQKISASEAELLAAETLWESCVQKIGCRLECSDAGIAQGRQAWDQQRRAVNQQIRFAQEWTRYIESAAESLAEKLPGFANLIAATTTRWHGGLKFHEAFANPIDLLVIEDAGHLTEAEILKLTRHARKAVLVGCVRSDVCASASDQKARPAPGNGLPVSTAWNRIWHVLNGSSSCRPVCTWRRVDGRLICQLQPLSPEDMRYLETETLADSPDIELHILHRPRSRPSLVQMTFAPRCEFVEAFLFMSREVQEFPLEPLGRTSWWSERDDKICRWFGLPTHSVQEWVELERGLRLAFAPAVGDSLPRVLMIEFDRLCGWDRTSAQNWLKAHRVGNDCERTVYLQTPYRFSRELCDRLRGMESGDWLPAEAGCADAAHGIEFLAVPVISGPDWPSQGAGLEQDLTLPRHSDKLPSMLRTGLPNKGYANLYEAQAVIRQLESLVREEVPATPRPHLVVVALYDGQIELIRKLMEQSTVIKARPLPIELTTAKKLRQRECDILILSLTRSHQHRSVPFGDDADDLALAMTRARRRVIVIGDPGTLIKRVQTSGIVDRRDAQSAANEQSLLAKLVNVARG